MAIQQYYTRSAARATRSEWVLARVLAVDGRERSFSVTVTQKLLTQYILNYVTLY